MELRDIEIFLTLAEELHFGRTAERLHVTPARVSQAISKQERRIGAPLFERTNRRVELTPIGRRLRESLAQAHHLIQTGLAEAAAMGRGIQGTIRLGTMGVAGDPLRPIVDAFEQRYPTCRVDVVEFHFSDPFTPLRNGDIDIQLTWLPIMESDLTTGPVIFTEGRALAVHAEDPLADAEAVSVDDLGDRVTLDPGPRTPDYWIESMIPRRTPTGRLIRRGPAARTFHEVLSLVASGQIVSPVNAHVRHYYSHPLVRFLPMKDAPLTEWALVWHGSNNEAPHLRALVETAHEIASEVVGRSAG